MTSRSSQIQQNRSQQNRSQGNQARPEPRRRGFTLTEIMVVVGILVLLVALLLPALSGVTETGWRTDSMSRMRQIGQAMSSYSSDSADTVLASQFNHANDPFVGQTRKGEAFTGEWELRGTWADTLWTRLEMGVFPEALIEFGNDYRNDSPDKRLYEFIGDNFNNGLRSAGPNSRNSPGPLGNPGDNLATPYGPGAQEVGWPGYFAANNFFNADATIDPLNKHWSTGQIRSPARSMYLVDSFAGETIEDDPAPFDNTPNSTTIQVDFRYGDQCLMLFLDGHVDTQSPWLDLDELENDRKVRVRVLDKR